MEINSSVLEIVKLNYFYNQLSSFLPEHYLKLLMFIFGMLVYSIFIWHSYKKLARRDIFKIDLKKYDLSEESHKTLKKVWSVLLYILKYGVLFPFYVILWFFMFSIFLFLLGTGISAQNVIFISISYIATTRIASYYKEDLSNDLAKLLPFSLLAILITNPSFFSIDMVLQRFSQLTALGSKIFEFLVFIVFLEWIIRFFYVIKNALFPEKIQEAEIQYESIEEKLS